MSWGEDLPAGSLRTTDPDLYVQFVEHLMRSTDDDTVVFTVLAAPDMVRLRAALGSVLPHLHGSPFACSPIAAVLGYGPLEPAWRSKLAEAPMSLWSELELMRTLGITSPARDPLVELLNARE